MSSTKTPTGSFYAVRKGRHGLEKCIFLSYKDAQPFLEGEEQEEIEYHVFDALEEAAAYLQSTTGVEPLDAEMLASIATVVNLPPVVVPPAPPAAKKRRTSYESTDGSYHRKPTKKWEECFAILKESKEGGFKDQDLEKMTKWMKDQRYNYKLYQQGKPSSMTAEKIRRLQQVDFKLPEIECTAPLVKQEAAAHPSKEKRGIYKKWHENRAALKEYMDTHDGSWDIPRDTPNKEHAKLLNWLTNQQAEYKKFMNGQESSMTAEKLSLLKEIGFEFSYVSFDERFEQLRAFKQQHGHVNVPATHPELGKWMASMRRQLKSFSETATNTRDLNAQRFAQLTALGVHPHSRGGGGAAAAAAGTSSRQEDEKWQEMFASLEHYKRIHGHVNVKRTEETKALSNWLVLQRNEYKKLQQGKPSKLTAPRLVQFQQVGFEFGKRGSYKNWEERIQQLKEYRNKHGHANVPVSDPELGEFLSRQRVQYNKMRNGEKTSLTQERIDVLRELGVNFDAVAAPRRIRTTPNKTWEERFMELASFKNEFGHAVVPQHSHYTPGLGAWVKDQRRNYKAMLKGKKSPMTAERALRLASLGFVWDVFEQSKRRKRGDMEGEV